MKIDLEFFLPYLQLLPVFHRYDRALHISPERLMNQLPIKMLPAFGIN